MIYIFIASIGGTVERELFCEITTKNRRAICRESNLFRELCFPNAVVVDKKRIYVPSIIIMKIKTLLFAFVVVVGSQQLFAQPPTKNDAINLPFTGVYRAAAKTSIAKTGQTTAPIEEYQNLPELLATLPKDSALRSKYPFLKPMHHSAPGTRVQEEQRNVRIKDCWILVVKYEKSIIHTDKNGKRKRTGDNDFHLVVSSSPQFPSGQRMNMEVAGLPPNGGPDVSKLRQVRRDFLLMCAKMPTAGKFRVFSPPIQARIEGSLFFDGEHTADQIAPAYHLTTTWEVHPISKITRLEP